MVLSTFLKPKHDAIRNRIRLSSLARIEKFGVDVKSSDRGLHENPWNNNPGLNDRLKKNTI